MEEKATKEKYAVHTFIVHVVHMYLWILTLGGGSDKGRLGRKVHGFQILPTFPSTTKGCGSRGWGKEDWVSDLRRDCIPLPSGTSWCWTYGHPNRWEWPLDGKWEHLQKQRQWWVLGLSLGSVCFMVHEFVHLIIFTHSRIFQYLH